MGTSKSFSDIQKSMPNWPTFSSTVTRSCDGSIATPAALGNILGGYVTAVGGSGNSGRGKSRVSGRAGNKTAKKIARFFGEFISSGGDLVSALEKTGLEDVGNKTVSEIINHLIEYCSGPSSTIDKNAAKAASRQLLEEIAGSAKSNDELQELLKERFKNSDLEDLLIRYFGYYVLEHLASWFYEKLVKEKGKNSCGNLFRQIREFIWAKLKSIHKKNPLEKVKWGTKASETIIQNIQVDVLTVFEGYED